MALQQLFKDQPFDWRSKAYSADTAAPKEPTSVPAEANAASSSWSETFPPKLTAAVVTDLKNKFRQHYPAEVLMPDTTPSLRLLSLLHHQKTKKGVQVGSMEISP